MAAYCLYNSFHGLHCFRCGYYTTPAVAQHFFGTTDPNSTAYQEAGNWVGILFGVYNGVSAIIALLFPKLQHVSAEKEHMLLALTIGGLSFLSFYIIPTHQLLIIPMIGIGIAWGSILAMPYAMLANSIPPRQMGMFMGLFNMSITVPQIVNGIFGGLILRYIFNDDPQLTLIMAGVFMILGAISTIFVTDILDKKTKLK